MGDDEWRTPPYRFPALFYVPLNTGGLMWIRLEDSDELRVVYKDAVDGDIGHFSAYRVAARREEANASDVVMVRYLSMTMFHAFSDGNSFLPLAQDLFTLYDAVRQGEEKPALPPVTQPL